MKKRFLSICSVAAVMGGVIALSGCTPIIPDDVDSKVTLDISLNYNSTTGMKYAKDKDYTTPNGTVIKKGDFLPVWSAVQEQLDFTINDVTDSTGKATDYFENNWQKGQFADIAVGNVTKIVEYSVQGSSESILDLKPYIDSGKMPNFKKFLDSNPIVKVSLETSKYGNANQTAIYYAPYFDGMDDIEKYTLVRADFIEKLLDADFDSVDWDTNSTLWTEAKYTGTEESSYSVTVPKSMDSKETKTVTKASTENIVDQQNALAQSDRTSKVMVKQYRDYLNAKYGTQYSKLSDIFLGVDACYDADEMIALMRLVKVSPKALTGNENTNMIAFVPREYNNQRIADLYRWAGQLWGVRGVESRCGYLYIGSDGKVHDARGDKEIVTMLDNLNKLYTEGLILQNFHQKEQFGVTDGKYASKIMVGGNPDYCGFMEYDYSQTQGAWNDKDGSKSVEGYNFRPILGAVADWKGDKNYFHFTESWRSVKTEGWCISSAVASNEKKLNKAIELFDYFYSDEGQTLYTCGPASEGYTSGTITYKGAEVPKLSDKALEQFHDTNIGKDSYTDYFRQYVGAGLNNGSIKNYGVEIQCTSANAVVGCNIVAHAIEVGTYKHVEMNQTDDEFFTICPSSFNLSQGDSTKVSTLDTGGLGNINSKSSSSTYNIWDNYVMYGFGNKAGDDTLQTQEGYLNYINNTLKLTELVTIYNNAYKLMNF